MPNGSKYREEVPLLTNADVLQIDPSKTEKLDEIVTKSAEPIKKNGSEFYAIGSKVNSGENVMNFYQKVCIDPKWPAWIAEFLCTDSRNGAR